jgi:hypothetical protein
VWWRRRARLSDSDLHCPIWGVSMTLKKICRSANPESRRGDRILDKGHNVTPPPDPDVILSYAEAYLENDMIAL